ncbi:MAG TPA: heparinase II/III family protein [Treponemataceae bacterium]|jgi:hypothetical protein|nr:heparinase II/III family protein [Treponemataceae bacterium]
MIKEKIADAAISLQEFKLCPPLNHASWKTVPDELRNVLIEEGRKELENPWSLIRASDYLDFSRTENRKRFEDLYFSRRRKINDLVLYYIMLRTGSSDDPVVCNKVLDEIINGVMLLCEESAWQIPAHNNYIRNSPLLPFPDNSKPVIDLFASETGALLACIYFLLKKEIDSVSKEIGLRIERELKFRIIDPYLHEHFWWMGSGDGINDEPMCNWTTWCLQNVLIVFFSLKFTEEEKKSVMQKAAFSLDCFLKDYGEDGACCEGVQYYKHAGLCLYNIFEILNTVTDGSLKSIYGEKKIKNIAEFPFYMQVKNTIFFNFADCSPLALKAGIREYQFGKKVKSSYLCSLALQHMKAAPVEVKILKGEINLFYRLQNIVNIGKMLCAKDIHVNAVQKQKYYESCGIFVKSGPVFQSAVKTGNNGDDHNHNDTGSFIIYKEGKPVFIDIGVETYTAKTFSPHRYDIWTMQSAWHNLPAFSLEMQKDGKEYKACDVKYKFGKNPYISMDIAKAYKKSAGVKSYVRRIDYSGEEKITIHDFFVSESSLPSEVQYPVLSLITEASPVIKEDNGILNMELNGARISIQCLPRERNLYFVESIPIKDARLQEAWPDSIYRILLPFKKEIIIEVE